MTALEVTSVCLAAPIAISAGYYLLAQFCLSRWRHGAELKMVDPSALPPVTFLRPLKAGVPDLEGKLATLVRCLRAGDQLVIGADTGSRELAVAKAAAQTFPAMDISVVDCARGAAANPKISKLVQMESSARHEHRILSDSEMIADAHFLAGFRREWMGCDVLTAGYRFQAIRTWPQRLDAAAVLLTLWPGLAVLRTFGRVKLTMGACTGVRRSDLRTVGGWERFHDELAEDHRLGAVLAAARRTVRLSRHVATLESDSLSWRDYWRHQRRVAVTYRVANPRGFAGAWLSHGVMFGVILVAFRPAEFWTWGGLAGIWALRWLTAWRTSRELDFPIANLGSIVFLASLVETTCWLLSWSSGVIWWAGARWRISPEGRLNAVGANGRLPIPPEQSAVRFP